MLAAAGVGLALIPGAPQISLDPGTALALFIAPALVDAAFDFPAVAARKLWQPLFALAVLAVVLSATSVAGLGVALVGLPLYAAIALGTTSAAFAGTMFWARSCSAASSSALGTTR